MSNILKDVKFIIHNGTVTAVAMLPHQCTSTHAVAQTHYSDHCNVEFGKALAVARLEMKYYDNEVEEISGHIKYLEQSKYGHELNTFVLRQLNAARYYLNRLKHHRAVQKKIIKTLVAMSNNQEAVKEVADANALLNVILHKVLSGNNSQK